MGNTVIEVKKLEKQYGKQKVVQDLSFRIEEGMICGLIGPNGAGKTTIMKMLGGLVLPTGGEMELFGGSTEKELAKARSRISFMIETPYAKEKLTARENLEKQRIQKGIPDKKRVDEVLKLVGLEHTGKKFVKNFSLGMRQRLGIANALLSKPEIMILDEPTTGLHASDVKTVMELLDRLVERGNTVIVIEHNLDVMKRADWLIDVGPDGGTAGGQIVFTGTPLEMVEKSHTITAEYLRKSAIG